MSAKKLRLLAECLECEFMTREDRKGWINDLCGLANQIERGAVETNEADPAEA